MVLLAHVLAPITIQPVEEIGLQLVKARWELGVIKDRDFHPDVSPCGADQDLKIAEGKILVLPVVAGKNEPAAALDKGQNARVLRVSAIAEEPVAVSAKSSEQLLGKATKPRKPVWRICLP